MMVFAGPTALLLAQTFEWCGTGFSITYAFGPSIVPTCPAACRHLSSPFFPCASFCRQSSAEHEPMHAQMKLTISATNPCPDSAHRGVKHDVCILTTVWGTRQGRNHTRTCPLPADNCPRSTTPQRCSPPKGSTTPVSAAPCCMCVSSPGNKRGTGRRAQSGPSCERGGVGRST